MLHSKLMAMRMGGATTMTKATVALNRLQFVIENSVDGSIVAAITHSPRRYQHILCAQPTTTIQSSSINIDNVKYHSILSKKSTTTSVSVEFVVDLLGNLDM